MNLKIVLKSTQVATIENFKDISYPGYNNTTVITESDLSKFTINSKLTYVFKGSQTVIVKGEDIDLLIFE